MSIKKVKYAIRYYTNTKKVEINEKSYNQFVKFGIVGVVATILVSSAVFSVSLFPYIVLQREKFCWKKKTV